MKLVWLWLVCYLFMFVVSLYGGGRSDEDFRVKNSYLWYDKYPKTRTYTLKDLISDSPYFMRNVKPGMVFVVLMKIVLLSIWPIIKISQGFFILGSVLYHGVAFIRCYVKGETLSVNIFFTEEEQIKTIGSFIIFFIFKNPVCRGYKIIYTILKKWKNKERSKIGWRVMIYNFTLGRILGFSLGTIHNIDVLSNVFYESFSNEELRKGWHLWPQVLANDLYVVHRHFFDRVREEVRSLKIITSPCLILNPFVYFNKRFMLNYSVKKQVLVNGVATVIETGGYSHSGAVVGIGKNNVKGVLNTHRPLKKQISLKRFAFPEANDKRIQYTTLNNVFSNDLLVVDKTNLIRRTHVDEEGVEMLNFNDIQAVVSDNHQIYVHTKEGCKVVNPFKERNSGIILALEETSLWKNIRMSEYQGMSETEKKWHRQKINAYLNTTQKHYFFREGTFSRSNYFEEELRNAEGWKVRVYSPFWKND